MKIIFWCIGICALSLSADAAVPLSSLAPTTQQFIQKIYEQITALKAEQAAFADEIKKIEASDKSDDGLTISRSIALKGQHSLCQMAIKDLATLQTDAICEDSDAVELRRSSEALARQSLKVKELAHTAGVQFTRGFVDAFIKGTREALSE